MRVQGVDVVELLWNAIQMHLGLKLLPAHIETIIIWRVFLKNLQNNHASVKLYHYYFMTQLFKLCIYVITIVIIHAMRMKLLLHDHQVCVSKFYNSSVLIAN